MKTMGNFFLILLITSNLAFASSETESKLAIDLKIRNLSENSYSRGLNLLYNNDVSSALSLIEKEAEAGNEKATFILYYILSKSGDDQKALNWLKRSADSNYVPALHHLGLYYHYGFISGTSSGSNTDRPIDNKKAFQYFKEATLKGSLRSQARLALLYYEGLGVSQDTKKAYVLYLDAAQRGLYRAYSRVALDWYDREGITPNQAKYDEYWSKYKNNEDREPFCGEDNEGRDYDCGDNPHNILYEMYLHFDEYM